jgi:hypothetical protein
MRKNAQSALIALVVVLVAASAYLFVQYRKTSSDFTDMKAEKESTQTRYSQTIDAIAEIQDSLNAISVGDTNVQMLSKDLQAEQKLTGPDSREALDRIATLRASILRNKERIHQLEGSLKTSGIKIAGLQKMIGNLKQSVTEKEAMVAELSGRVDSLQTQVAGLATQVQENQETISQKDQAIEDKRRELATVYYIVGSKHDLKASGIVVAKGGLFGIGKTIEPIAARTDSGFVALDTDQETVVSIPAKRAQVVSDQPPTSYELKPENGTMVLRILDPVEFRKVKQLVILTG